MKTDKLKQVICISESNPVDFQDRMNEALSQLSDPDIRMDPNMPFTATIVYTVRRDLPETVLEMLELVDGGQHTCRECPHYMDPDDKRSKHGCCAIDYKTTRLDSRACEHFYIFRYRMLNEAKEKYAELPFTVE